MRDDLRERLDCGARDDLLSARVSHFAYFETLVQMSYCVKAYGCRLFDLRADSLLRSGRKTGVIRPSCSWCTALEPLVGNYQTFVQIAYCVRVYGCRLSDLRARNAARKQVVAHVWSATQPQTLQTREKFPAFGALTQPQLSKHEKSCARLELQQSHKH